MTPALEFRDITKEYRGIFGRDSVRALVGFSLVVQPGEIFGFLGPNGAGKTTAIHLALGFTYPTSGSGSMLGMPFGHAPTRSRVGFLAENVALYSRTARDVIRFYGALNGMRNPVLARRTREVLDQVRLSGEAGRNVKKYSRGMLQRIGLAQALVNDPDLLILDEPTSALDPLARVEIRELLVDLRRAGKTVFLSSHLLSEVEVVCDRVAILKKGRVVQLGRTEDLLNAGDRMEVVARGPVTPLFEGATANDGLVTFSIQAAEQRKALERIWNAGGEIVSMNPARRTLEEVFMQATNEGDAEQ
jgi:ABC-2 type transport system ATP-binding protein